MTRPAKRATRRKAAAKSPTRVQQAAKQVADDADQVRADLDRLLKSLEGLGVEALREVSDRALVLIAEKTGNEKRGFMAGVVDGAKSIGELITGLFGGSDSKAAPARRSRRAKAGRVTRNSWMASVACARGCKEWRSTVLSRPTKRFRSRAWFATDRTAPAATVRPRIAWRAWFKSG